MKAVVQQLTYLLREREAYTKQKPVSGHRDVKTFMAIRGETERFA